MRVSTRRVFIGLVGGFCLAGAYGCATVAGEGKSVTAVYMEGVKQAGIEDNRPMKVAGTETMGDMSPYFPIVLPPEVIRGWVPDHVNGSGKLVAGHWIYVMVRDSRFALEDKSLVMRRGIGGVVPHGSASRMGEGSAEGGAPPASSAPPSPGRTPSKPPAGVTIP